MSAYFTSLKCFQVQSYVPVSVIHLVIMLSQPSNNKAIVYFKKTDSKYVINLSLILIAHS